MKTANRRGKRLLTPALVSTIADMHRRGVSYAEISRRCNVSEGSVANALTRAKAAPVKANGKRAHGMSAPVSVSAPARGENEPALPDETDELAAEVARELARITGETRDELVDAVDGAENAEETAAAALALLVHDEPALAADLARPGWGAIDALLVSPHLDALLAVCTPANLAELACVACNAPAADSSAAAARLLSAAATLARKARS